MKWEIFSKSTDDLRTQILINRGITDPKDQQRFLNPSLDDFPEAFILSDLDVAVDRINDAIAKNEKIIIYGDYDVDGICSSAIMYRGLKNLGADVKPFIPHRMEHGYGLSVKGLEDLLGSGTGVNLLITVDNGIVAYEGLAFAKKRGIDVIVTDHHEKGDKKVEAIAVVHTTEMCGSGVAWTLIKELVSDEVAEELLQLAAIGTIADVMPMVGVNRAIVTSGMVALKKTPNLGIKILAKQLNMTVSQLTPEKISFDLIPKMNAAGRLDSAMPALRMLCFDDPWKVEQLAENLIELNNDRRTQTQSAIEEALLQIDSTDHVNVVVGNWHPGIVGLVAGRITEMTSRPTLAIALNNGNGRGSARSVIGVNIVELLRSKRELFTELGGHSGAAGFGVQIEMVKLVKDWLRNTPLDRSSESVIRVDTVTSPQSINSSLINDLEGLSPFGGGNPRPILASLKVKIRDFKKIGNNGKHLKLLAEGIDAVGFGMGDMYEELQKAVMDGLTINLAYKVEMNEFNGRSTPQMKLVDLVIEN